MNKVCGSCGRENAGDAYHCYACRSRDFGRNSPTVEYRAIQQRRAVKREEQLLQEAIESYTPLPGTRQKALLLLVSICSALIGFLVGPGKYAGIFVAVGAILFAWVVLLRRIESYRSKLERRLRSNQQRLRGDSQ